MDLFSAAAKVFIRMERGQKDKKKRGKWKDGRKKLCKEGKNIKYGLNKKKKDRRRKKMQKEMKRRQR